MVPGTVSLSIFATGKRKIAIVPAVFLTSALILLVSNDRVSHADEAMIEYDGEVQWMPFPEPPEFGSVVEPYEIDPYQSNAFQPNAPRPSRLNLLTESERAPFRFMTSFAPEQDVANQSGPNAGESLSAFAIGTQVGFPLRMMSDGILLGIGTLKYTRLSTSAVLPESNTPIPDELWDIRTGAFISRDLASGWKVGGLFNVGSASDEPFESFDELTLTTLGFLSVPAQGRDSWNFSLFYSPTSQIRFPIPGIAYAWRPNDALEAQIGLPASLIYAPNDSFSFRARYTPVTDVFVETRQMLSKYWSVFARYQIFNETYFLADREDREDRFFQFEQQLAAGLARQLPAGFTFELSAGYLFDRRFIQSDDFDLNAEDMIEVDPGAVYSMQLIWTI